jgi:hypothetical protein
MLKHHREQVGAEAYHQQLLKAKPILINEDQDHEISNNDEILTQSVPNFLQKDYLIFILNI